MHHHVLKSRAIISKILMCKINMKIYSNCYKTQVILRKMSTLEQPTL